MIDVVVVGFGFSAVPLVRELEATGTEFTIISAEGDSVWERLSKSGRLDCRRRQPHKTRAGTCDRVTWGENPRISLTRSE